MIAWRDLHSACIILAGQLRAAAELCVRPRKRLMIRQLALVSLVVLLAVPGATRLRVATCVPPRADTRQWPEARSPRLPGLTLRVPPGFRRDPGEDTYRGPPPHGSRWTGPGGSQLVVSRVRADSVGLRPLPGSAGRPEYSRCEERIGDAKAVIVSYNHLDEVGDMAYLGPFQVYAQLRPRTGAVIELYGSTSDRTRFDQLLASVRTVRWAAP